MTTRKPRISNIGHTEDNSVVVEYAGMSLAVLDTGGDYRVTKWCPLRSQWEGDCYGIFADRQPAIDHASRLVQTLPR